MDKAKYVMVAKLGELHEHQGKLVKVDGEDVALFKRNGEIYALSNVCAHQHFSMLHQGEIVNLTVTCPMHGWTYDMVTGKAVNGSGRVKKYDVKVKGELVYVEFQREEFTS